MGRREFPQPTRLRQVGLPHHLTDINLALLANIVRNRLKDQNGDTPPGKWVTAVIAQLTSADPAEVRVFKSQFDDLGIKQAIREIRNDRGLTPAAPSYLAGLLTDIVHCQPGDKIHALGKSIIVGGKRFYLTAVQPTSPPRQKRGQGKIQPFLTLTRMADIRSSGWSKGDRFLAIKPERQKTH